MNNTFIFLYSMNIRLHYVNNSSKEFMYKVHRYEAVLFINRLFMEDIRTISKRCTNIVLKYFSKKGYRTVKLTLNFYGSKTIMIEISPQNMYRQYFRLYSE